MKAQNNLAPSWLAKNFIGGLTPAKETNKLSNKNLSLDEAKRRINTRSPFITMRKAVGFCLLGI